MNRQPSVGTARSAIVDPQPVKAVVEPEVSRVLSLVWKPANQREGESALHTELTLLWACPLSYWEK